MPTNPQIETEIDRLAKAMRRAAMERNCIGYFFDEAVPPSKEEVANVRAVLLALREPSEGALKAAERVGAYDGSGYYQAKRFWPAMLDHILNESDGQ